MGSLSLTHILILGLIALVFFGPNRLPTLGRSMGEAIRGFKKGLNGDEIDVTEQGNARRESLSASQDPAQADGQRARQNNPINERT